MKQKSFEQILFETRQDVRKISLQHNEPIVSPDGYENERIVFRDSRNARLSNWYDRVLNNPDCYRDPTEDEIRILAEIKYRTLNGEKEDQPPRLPADEDFIRKVEIAYANDVEVKIRLPGKSAKIVSCQAMGFQNENAKPWKVLISILKDPVHIYCVGQVKGERKQYDTKVKLLRELNKKLKDCLKTIFSLPVTGNEKLYERDMSEKSGTYRLKLSINDGKRSRLDGPKYKKYEDEDYLKDISLLEAEINASKDESIKAKKKDELADLIERALKEGVSRLDISRQHNRLK